MLTTFLNDVAEGARGAGVFGGVRVEGGRVVCDALASAEPAFYSVSEEGGRTWVALQTPARYLSQSIEADLMFTGDKVSDLVHEEMVDQGYAEVVPGAPELPVEHFRSAEKLYTFRSALPEVAGEHAVRLALVALLGYEAAFRALGDMTADEE
jgi:hypothetical protein